MTHLTTKQVLQFVDGTLDYAAQAQCTSHLAVCPQCRKEVDLQKAIAKVSRTQPLVRASATLVRQVMARVAPNRQVTWKTKLVDNLGNVIAMTLVLAFMGYAITSPSLFHVQQETPQQSVIVKTVVDAYNSVAKSISERANVATQKVALAPDSERSKALLLTLVSFLILISLDQFILKKYVGLKTKH